jgi:hypothetical protein
MNIHNPIKAISIKKYTMSFNYLAILANKLFAFSSLVRVRGDVFRFRASPEIEKPFLFFVERSEQKSLIKRMAFKYDIKQSVLLLVLLGCAVFSMAQNKPKKMALQDRIDLAMKQEFEMTKDPRLNFVPRNGLIEVIQKMKVSATTRSIPTISWTERGPDNVGGRTRSILIDQLNPNSVFAGSVGGGLWHLNNASGTGTPYWTNVADIVQNLAVSCLAQHPVPSKSDTMYLGTGEGFFNSDGLRGLGIWRSTNRGTNWTHLAFTNNNPDFYFVNKIVVTPSGVVLAAVGVGYAESWAGNGGIMRSTDGGITWSKIFNSSTHDMELAANGDVYAACRELGVYKSTDGGLNWALQGGGLPNGGFGRVELATAPSDANTVYALFDYGFNNQKIYKSTDGSTSWVLKTTPVVNGNNTFASGQGWYDLIAAVDPNNPNRLFIGGIGIFMSNDGGSNWSYVGGHYAPAFNKIHPDQHVIMFEPNSSSNVYFGNDGGIYRSTDAHLPLPSTTVINKGYNVTQYYAAAIHPTAGSNYYLAGAQDNGTQKYTKSGINSTSQAVGADGAYCHIDQDNPKIQIASYQSNDIFVSKDSGLTWSYINSGGGYFINPTDYDDATNVLYGPYTNNPLINNQFFYIKDVGLTATNALTSVTVSQFNGTMPTAVKASPNVPVRVYFALRDGQLIRIDNAITPTRTVTVLGKPALGSGWVSSIEVKKGNENHILMTFSNYGVISVWSSIDAGLTWTNVEGNLPNMPIRGAIFAPDTSRRVLLATELGVWMTDSLKGANTVWAAVNAGLPNVRVDMLVARDTDKVIAAATHGRGLYTTTSLYSLPDPTASNSACVPPTGLTVSSVRDTALSLVWNFVPAAVGYVVQYRSTATAGANSVRAQRIAPEPNTSGFIIGGDRQFVWTNQPNPIGNGTRSGGGNFVDTLDTARTNAERKGALNTREVLVGEWKNDTVTNNSAELTGLIKNTPYEIHIKTLCTTGTIPAFSGSENIVTTGIPICSVVPTGLFVTQYNYPASVDFIWAAQAGVKGYVVEWRKAGTSDAWLSDYTIYSDYYHYNVSLNIVPNTNYEFRVKSVCTNDLESAYSAVYTFKSLPEACGTPVTLTLQKTIANAAYFGWTNVYTEGFVLAYRKVGETNWLYRSFSNINTAYQLDSLLPATNYECKVKTACPGGIDLYSNIVSFTTLAALCENINVTGMKVVSMVTIAATTNETVTNTSVTISWNRIPGVVNYRLFISSQSVNFTSALIPDTFLTFPITTLNSVDWSIFYYNIRPDCPYGSISHNATYQAFSIGKTCPQAIPLLENWKDNVTATTARIHWGKSKGDAIDPIAHYIVRYRPASFGGSTDAPYVTAGTTTNLYFDFTNLTPHTNYDYTVIACSVNSAYSYFVYRTVTTTDAVAPCGTPATLTTSNLTNKSVKITWPATGGAIQYVVEYKTAVATTWNSFTVISTLEYTLTGLTPLTDYNVRVRTDCSTTCIDLYATANFTTNASLALKVFLEGPYDGAGKMKDDLRVKTLIPTTEPYTGLAGFTHSSGGGGETTAATVLNTTGNNAIVDWVFIELKDATTPANIFTRSALLQADGDIVDVDGVLPLSIALPLGSYFITVKHRNHVGLKTVAVPLNSTASVLDLTNAVSPIGFSARKTLSDGKMGLWAGDLNQDGSVNNTDRQAAWTNRNLTGYNKNDCSMNGTVDATDRSQTWNNRGVVAPF